MDKRYKIVITEFTTEEKVRGKEWKPVNGNPDIDYKYTPEITKQIDVERILYTQNTDELDIVHVIKAVNAI
jgi:hypothetical protein